MFVFIWQQKVEEKRKRVEQTSTNLSVVGDGGSWRACVCIQRKGVGYKEKSDTTI